MAVGRISGPLLKANLLRNGVDLAFETDLLYLDVNTLRVGIKTNAPTHDLTVNGTTRTTNLETTTQANIANLSISGNTINSNSSNLNLTVTDTSAVVYQKRLKVDKITINNNVISTNVTNTDLELQPNGLGQVKVYGDTTVYGNLHATGNITADGDIQIGDQATDSVTFNAEVSSDFIPKTNNFYDLGKSDHRWANLYANNVIASTLTANTLIVDNIDLTARQGNIYYVSKNGSDTKSGTHQNDTFLTVKKALSVAVSGDTVFIYPGIYEEIFPLTIPSGVSVRGIGLRSVTIKPTTGTVDKDAFLLNGETTVEDVTITGFKFNSIANTGYAFRFASGFTVTTRSPYIRNITVITAGSVTSLSDPRGFASGDAGKGAFLDGSVATSSSKEATCLFHSATFICPGVDVIVSTNGTRIEWLNSFTYFANRSMYLYSGTQGFANIGKTRLKINYRSGGWNVGDTLTYYDTDGITVLASGTIASIDGNFVNLTGRCLGFETVSNTTGKTVTAQGTAELSISEKKWGVSSLSLANTIGSGTAAAFATIGSTTDFKFDRAPNTITVNGNAVVSSTRSKIGGSSIYFDGTGDSLSVPSTSVFGYGSNDFAFEFWINLNSVNGVRTPKALTVNGNTIISTTQSKFGGTAVYFDGTGDYVNSAVTSDFGFTSDYTVEFWAYRTVTQLGTIIDFHGVSGNYHQVNLSSTGVLRYAINGATVITGATLTLNTWCHVAVSRSGNTVKMFFNGSQSGASYTDTTTYPSSAITIGTTNLGASGFGGYLDEIRVSNNARYTGTFTTSTSAFPNDANTLLLIHANNINGSTDIVDDTDGPVIWDQRTSAVQLAPMLWYKEGALRYHVNGSDRIIGSSLSTNTWYHIAINRTSGSTKLFVDGTQSGLTYTDSTVYIQSPIVIGTKYDGTFGVDGYIDEIRVSTVSRYLSTFSPSTLAFTNDSNTALLIHGDSSITDDADISSDFTIEAWIYTRSSGQEQFITDQRDSVATEIKPVLSLSSGNVLKYSVAGTTMILGTTLVTTNVWHHVAVSRYNGITKLYLDGVQEGASYTDINSYTISPLVIGAKYDYTYGFDGYIDDLRIEKGVAKYTASAFTVAGQALISDPNTVLMLHFDGANNSTTFVDDGVVFQDLRTGAGGTASLLNYVDYSDFGTEVRSIASASVYGNYGIYGDGSGVVAYLIGQNLAYIGNGKEVTNDPTTVMQANEIVELNDAKIYYQSVDHKGDFRVGEYFYVNQQTGEVTFGPSAVTLTSNLTFDDGAGNITYIDPTKVETGDFRISGNTIRTLSQDFNVQSATGVINLLNNVNITGDLGVTGDVTIGGNITIGDQTTDSINFIAGITSDIVPETTNTYDLGTSLLTWKDAYFQNAYIGGITFTGTQIQPTTAGNDLTLLGNGTGKVIIESIGVQDNTISSSSNNDLTLQPNGTGIVKIDSTQSLLLPKGDDSQRPGTPLAGMIRWSTERNRYEGYDGFNWIQINGVADSDGNTKITAELTPGANDNIIRFYVDGNVVSTVTSDAFTVQKLAVDNVTIDNNTIGTVSGSDLTLQADGTGAVIVQKFRFKDNTITNTVDNAITTFTQTGTGYVKFDGTNGVVIPSGRLDQRPAVRETGMMRFNTDELRVEVFNGSEWTAIQGPSGGITRYEAEEIAVKYALTLG